MTTIPSSPLLIAGAGPVGLALGVELARRQVPFRIFDRAPARSTASKALGVFPRTLEVFAAMGVLQPALAAGHLLHGLRVHSASRQLAHIAFAELDTPYPFLLSLPQSETERILAEHLTTLGVEVERQTELAALTQDADGVTATLRHSAGGDGAGREEVVRTRWLLGCDGAHSTARHQLGASFEGAPYEEGFVLADFEGDVPCPEDEVSLFFHPRGLLGLFPFGRGRYRMVADLPREAGAAGATGPSPEPTLEPNQAEIQQLIDERGPGRVELRSLLWVSHFRISRRMVTAYRHGRVLLAGDAAHIHSPAGGQGMNTGIQDAWNLGWKLALVAAEEAPAALLDSYGAEREPVARAVLHLTDRITETALLIDHPFAQRLRDLVLPLLTGIGPLTHRIADTLAELAVAYRHSSIVAEHWGLPFPGLHSAGPAAGDRAPDGALEELGTGAPRRLFELFREPRHTLLLFAGSRATGDAPSPLDLCELGRVLADEYPRLLLPHLILPAARAAEDPGAGTARWRDPEGAVHHRYGADSPCLYLIRPDGYVAYRSLGIDTVPLLQYLERVGLA
jgi:2-polyprenyl-6-methoxyphenol hydroxylase-like FAD-dependent oxidoreductase